MKVVLGYSGGLDTSVIVPWLRETYDAEVVCMAGDVGQRGGLEGLEEKALATGAAAFHGMDLRRTFVEDYVWPTLRAGAVYGRTYLLGTAMARPILAKAQVEIARAVGADALAHGCTGKGNDQVRFELTYAALAPDLSVIAPWREWDIRSREDALAYARARGISLAGIDETKLYSRDENLWHISHEGGPLEDPALEPEEEMFSWTVAPEAAPDRPEYVEIGFESGTPVSVNGPAHGFSAPPRPAERDRCQARGRPGRSGGEPTGGDEVPGACTRRPVEPFCIRRCGTWSPSPWTGGRRRSRTKWPGAGPTSSTKDAGGPRSGRESRPWWTRSWSPSPVR